VEAAFADAKLKVPAVLTADVAKTGKPMTVGSIESRLGKPLNSHITCLAMQDSKRIQRYGWTGQQSGSDFFDLAPSILHYNWF
jgi:hypothetical protein